MSSRIEQIIEEIEEYIDRDCKFQPLSQTKIIVNKEHMDELLRELRMKTPDEIKRYQKIIANRDDSYTTKYDGLINSLQECYDTVRSNRAELDVPEADSSDYNYDSQNGSDQ